MGQPNIIFEKIQQSEIDIRDKIASLPPIANLPSFVDMKLDVLEVEDQGTYGSCTANAGCSALEIMYNKHGKKYDFSRLYLYYYTRQLGNLKGDKGAWPRDIGKALNKYGVCFESTWDYTEVALESEPSAEAKAEAEKFKILSYEQLVGDDKVALIKNAIAQGIPVLLTMNVHPHFMTLRGVWQTHWWNTLTSQSNPVTGAHEVLVIGYDDESQRLLVENSWGPYWADGGFFGMPYSIVNSDHVGELWILNPDLNTKPKPVEPIVKEKSFNIDPKMLIAAVVVVFIVVLLAQLI